MYLFCKLILLNRDLYKLGWVGLGWVKRFFQPNPPLWVKENQPKTTHMDQIGSMDWINFFLITIIIKLIVRTIPNQHKLFKNLRFEFYLGGGWVD